MYIKESNFALWCDFIEREFLDNEFKEMLNKEIVNGATSNPAIFKNAFLNSPAYKDDINALKGKSPKEIYENLAIKDIQKAADILHNLYEKGDDGFISIEVDPFLCDDAQGTIKEAKRLYKEIGKKNVMIKIPATEAGFIAINELFSEGISVNATLIFSPEQSLRSLDAFSEGLDRFREKNLNQDEPKGVISVFVSRFDRKMDDTLFDKNIRRGILGIINANKIYHQIEDRGIKQVRTLFASTGVKGGELSPDFYIAKLLFKNAVNTAPIETIEEFLKSNNKSVIEPLSQDVIDGFFDVLKDQNIDINEVYQELMSEGLEAFKDAFQEILKELEKG